MLDLVKPHIEYTFYSLLADLSFIDYQLEHAGCAVLEHGSYPLPYRMAKRLALVCLFANSSYV